ncbi:MAG: hypothetical protein KDA60_11890 [Planctomycetales bacterium]|nr:hypothetical protein [Planctomycetales bacterium]
MDDPPTKTTWAARGPRTTQFSIGTILALTTVLAVVLAVLLGVGRAFGMSATSVVTGGIVPSLLTLPVMIVWIVGLILAVRGASRYPLASKLMMIAFLILILGGLSTTLGRMVILHFVTIGGAGPQRITWAFTTLSLLSIAGQTVAWILIVVALFIRRPDETEGSK